MREMIMPRMNGLEEKTSYLAQGTQNLPHLKPGKKQIHKQGQRKKKRKKKERGRNRK